MFEWDRHNLRKVRAHGLTGQEVEDAMTNSPILVYEQDVEGEPRYVYYSETSTSRMLAIVITERGEWIRVITAYELDAGQKPQYLAWRAEGE